MHDEVEAVEARPVEESSTDLEVRSAAATLFRTDDPATVLKRAKATAQELMPVVREAGLIQRIGQKDHLKVEAWQTLGAMLGVTPVVIWTHKLDDGWEARVEARTLDGRVVGAAEAECLRSEGRWSSADDFAIRSMAQTRATSKALSSPLRFIATLGGASGTPAEEMPADGGAGGAGKSRAATSEASKAQKSRVTRDLANVPEPYRAPLREKYGAETKQGASELIDALAHNEWQVVCERAGIEVEVKSEIPDDPGA